MVFGQGRARADAHKGAFLPELLEVHPGQRLTKHLGHAIEAIGAECALRTQPVGLPVKADRVVGAGENDARLAMGARSLVQIVEAEDIGLQDRLKGRLDRNAAKVNDAVTPRNHRVDRRRIGEVAPNYFFIRAGVINRGDIRKSQGRGNMRKSLAHDAAKPTCRAGYQQTLHAGNSLMCDCKMSRGSSAPGCCTTSADSA